MTAVKHNRHKNPRRKLLLQPIRVVRNSQALVALGKVTAVVGAEVVVVVRMDNARNKAVVNALTHNAILELLAAHRSKVIPGNVICKPRGRWEDPILHPITSDRRVLQQNTRVNRPRPQHRSMRRQDQYQHPRPVANRPNTSNP